MSLSREIIDDLLWAFCPWIGLEGDKKVAKTVHQGWECPRCKAVNAPGEKTCAACSPAPHTTQEDAPPRGGTQLLLERD